MQMRLKKYIIHVFREQIKNNKVGQLLAKGKK